MRNPALAAAVFVVTILTIAVGVHFIFPKKSLQYKVYYSEDTSDFATSSLLIGAKDAVLVDSMLARSDAFRIVSDVLHMKKRLSYIVITNYKPEYYVGATVIKQAFPNVKVVSTEYVINKIKASQAEDLKNCEKKLGENCPKNFEIPEDIKTNTIELESNKIEIIGLDSDTPEHTFVWVPSIKTVFGSETVYDNIHLDLRDYKTPNFKEMWLKRLQRIQALNPVNVVPGHTSEGEASGTDAWHFTKDYILSFERSLENAKNRGSIIAAMKEKYPDMQLSENLINSANQLDKSLRKN